LPTSPSGCPRCVVSLPVRMRGRGPCTSPSLMVSWWPHINMHTHNGTDLQGLILIDYLFHLPSMVAAVVLAYCFFSLLREGAKSRNHAD
jgi:hypothetical protein